MQFQYEETLPELDTEELDDENMQTELQHYLNQCISIISVAASVEPLKIFDLINNEFNREDGKLNVFIAFLNTLPDFSKESSKIPVNVEDFTCFNESSKTFFFHCLIRDLASLLQTITELSSVTLLATDQRSHSISIVIRACIYLLALSNRKKLYLYNFTNPSVATDLVELQAQTLTSVRSLLLLRNDIYEDHDEIFGLITTVAQVLLPRFEVVEPLIVTNSSAQLMLTITSGIRPNFILKHTCIMELLESNLSHQPDKHVRLTIKRIIFNCLLLPYNQIPVNQVEEQEYDTRQGILTQYVSFISNKFLTMDISVGNPMVFEQTKTELSDYEELLLNFEDTNTITKQMLLAGLQKVINKAIEMFQKFAKTPTIYEEIVNFFLGVVRCLQLQLGTEFVVQIIRMFLEMATVSNGNTQALNKLLQMLIFIVQSGGGSSLLNDVLKVSLDDLLPLEVNRSADISVNLFSLFDAILQNHWNYFHKIQTASSNQRNHHDDLIKIFNAYGQFLCNVESQDPNVIRIILSSLEKLNNFYRLYDKVFFKNLLLKSFLCTLLRLVLLPSGILFYDQIVAILFHMSEKSKTQLQESFLSIGYPTDVKIIQQICETSSIIEFSSNMEILIQDTIYSQFLQ